MAPTTGLCHGAAHGRIVVHGIVHGIDHGRPWVRSRTTPWRRVSMASFMDDAMASSVDGAMDGRITINVDYPSCVSFFNPNRVSTLTFPMYDDVTSYSSRFARLTSQ